MNHLGTVVLTVCLLFLLVGWVLAGGEGLPRSLVGSGGGGVSQGEMVLQTAVGQPAVGAVENGLVWCTGYLCGSGAPPITPPRYALYLPTVLK